MNKNISTFKKFQFFEQEKATEIEGNKQQLQSVDYNLSTFSPVELRVHNKLYYLNGQKRGDIKTNLFRIVKINPLMKIIDEYIPFNDSIIDFDIKDLDGKTYLIALGTDLKNSEVDERCSKIEQNNQLNKEITSIRVVPSPKSIPSIKIFDFSKYVEKTNCEINEWKGAPEEGEKEQRIKFLEEMMSPVATIYLMRRKTNESEFYSGNTISALDESFVPITDITCFSVAPKLNSVSLSLGNDTLVQIRADESFNLINGEIKLRKYSLIKSSDKKNITNIKYIQIGPDLYLYFTTTETIYYKKYQEVEIHSVGIGNDHSGADEKNFGLGNEPGQFIIATSNAYYLEEYFTADKGRSWFFEKPKKFTQFFKGYLVFVLYEENLCKLCVYDTNNSIFILYNTNLNNILSVITDKERIYVLSEGMGTRKITSFKEKDNKEKFDTFYKKSFFETALNYAKNLRYDKKKLSEISKLHAEHLYKKGDYEKSIEQYKATINYLDPSYVIQKFLDGSKLNYLIEYLEALQNNEEFKKNCAAERLTDFTALLLNCYIKQKKIKELKEFVESKNIDDEVTIKTAIEVCKDTNKIELALSIAQKANMVESYIQILMDIKADFAESLDYIKQLSDIEQKFNLLIKYGEKFIERKEVIDDAMKVISALVTDIINIRNKKDDNLSEEEKRIKNLNYEKIISIFITKDSEAKLETLLDTIMIKDNDCPKQIILRRIELYVDKYTEGKMGSTDVVDKIRDILTNEKFKDKLDKNYLLMLFKISGFNQGVTELSKIMKLDQDLLQIYMETHEYKKINMACESIMSKDSEKDKKVNYWLQALNYYISISTQSTKSYLGEFIIDVLDHLANSKEEDFSPMILLDILDKARSNHGHIIEFKVIKKYIIDWIRKQQESLKNDKKETEANYNKIEANNQQLKELQVKAKPYNLSKCSICGQPLDIPFVYFACGHGFHQLCLSGESYEEVECSTCKAKNNQLMNRIEGGKKLAEDPKQFFDELKRSNEKKFDIFAKYLGKGIFINKNEEPDKKESNTISGY